MSILIVELEEGYALQGVQFREIAANSSTSSCIGIIVIDSGNIHPVVLYGDTDNNTHNSVHSREGSLLAKKLAVQQGTSQ